MKDRAGLCGILFFTLKGKRRACDPYRWGQRRKIGRGWGFQGHRAGFGEGVKGKRKRVGVGVRR
jgi:hypothetical protein